MITQLKLDESTKLEFGVSVTGADSTPTARFIIEGKEFSIMIPCRNVNESAEVEIPVLKNIIPAGEYPVRLEVIIDNKIYTPMHEQMVFEPCIEIATKSKPVQAIRESVQVAKVTVKKSVNENILRKTQAATIIAQSLGYHPEENETPRDIIEHAIEQAGEMSPENAATVEEMLRLAESTGIDIIVSPKVKAVIVEEKKTDPDEDDLSDDELDDMINGLEDDDYYDAYEDDELAVIDHETGEEIKESVEESEQLDEVLSRVERMKAKIRMARTKTKREAKLKIALRRHSTGAKLNQKARRMAVKAMEKKIARKPLDQLSVGEKERVERIIATKKKALSRLAMKMVPRIRQIEKDRLSHNSFTQH